MSKRAKAAAAAAKRIPVVGTAVVVAPILRAAVDSGISATNLNMGSLRSFANHLMANFTGVDETGVFAGQRLITTYTPIASYLLARRFLGRHITRVFRPLRMRF